MTAPEVLFEDVRVVPVIRIESIDEAIPLAEALLTGGLRALEITLRTPVALEALSRLAKRFPEALIGAGTVVRADQVAAVVDAGARFAVTPGTTPALLDALEAARLPTLPGAATVSEAMALADRGFALLKLFPAEAIGGIPLLRSWAAPLPQLRFCPTGGIQLSNAPRYLELSNVACIGGSWMVPHDAIAAGRWDEIEKAAREAADL